MSKSDRDEWLVIIGLLLFGLITLPVWALRKLNTWLAGVPTIIDTWEDQ